MKIWFAFDSIFSFLEQANQNTVFWPVYQEDVVLPFLINKMHFHPSANGSLTEHHHIRLLKIHAPNSCSSIKMTFLSSFKWQWKKWQITDCLNTLKMTYFSGKTSEVMHELLHPCHLAQVASIFNNLTILCQILNAFFEGWGNRGRRALELWYGSTQTR